MLDMAYSGRVKVLQSQPKPVVWMGDTLERLKSFPRAVQGKIGFAVYEAQVGEKNIHAKPMKGFGAGVIEVVSDHRGDTFRAVYTVRLEGRIYVLHIFQKKSKSGIATPKAELEMVRQRLKRAVELHAEQEG
jgi:phage-related protein